MAWFDFRRDEAEDADDLPGQVADPTVWRDETVFQETRVAAVRSGLLVDEEERVDHESAFFGELAIAKTGCAPWSPEENPSDKLSDTRFRRALAQRDRLTEAVVAAEERMRDRERELADLGPEPPMPGLTRRTLAGVGAVALGPAIWLGLHGFTSVVLPEWAILLSLVPALGAAGLAVAASVGTAPPSSSTGRRIAVFFAALSLALVASIGVNVGPLGTLGPAPAWAAAFYVFGVVWLVELTASWLAATVAERHTALRPWHAGVARVAQARQELAARKAELRGVEVEIEEHEQLVALRTSTHLSGLEHAKAAQRTAEAGAGRGISEQDGWAWTGIRSLPDAHQLRARHRGHSTEEESEA
jgi:hypothetical protein